MLELIQQHWSVGCTVFLIVALAVLVISLILRLFRVAIGIVVAAVLIPIFFTIVWGDGSAYIEKITQFADDRHRVQIQQGYDEFKKQEAEDPIIDYDEITDVFTAKRDDAEDAVKGFIMDKIPADTEQTQGE